jgi:DNA-binding response OmpR family regulator
MNNGLPAAQSAFILLIEDSPTQAVFLQSLLANHGLQVICAVDGRMGIRLALQVHPALILLDVQMPDIDGFQVCRELKAHSETKDIPIIMLTRRDEPENIQKGIEAGATDYIPKDTFSNVVLLETLRQMELVNS